MEARDTELAIALWKEKAEQFGNPPPIAEFSLADPVGQSFRFMILADLLVTDASVFLAYGAGFAKLFALPERPAMRVPMIECIPNRYWFVFLEGCSSAVSEGAPVHFSGDIAAIGGCELYRACFMPLKMGIDTMRAVYGSFNFRFRAAAELAEKPRWSSSSSLPYPNSQTRR